MRIIIRWNGCQNIHINFRFRSLHALDIQNLSNRCRNKYDSLISRIFLIAFLAGFFYLDWYLQVCWSSLHERVNMIVACESIHRHTD